MRGRTCERSWTSITRGKRVVVSAALKVEKHDPAVEKKPSSFIDVTALASEKLRELRDSANKDCLRVGVKQGGCSGMSYFMEFEESANIADYDEVTEVESIKVVCDVKSLMYMYGMTLDYSNDLVGGGFKFFNPKATSTCGCGQSFGV